VCPSQGSVSGASCLSITRESYVVAEVATGCKIAIRWTGCKEPIQRSATTKGLMKRGKPLAHLISTAWRGGEDC